MRLDAFEKRPRITGALIALSTLSVFWPMLRHGFLDIDDNVLITGNAMVQRGLTREGLRWALTTNSDGLWYPLTWLSHMLDCQLFGLDPWGHHFVSLLFHAANAWLLFALLSLATRRAWPSALAALLFSLHPLRVESVAWAAERKDVLSVFFFLLTLLAYGWHASKPDWRRYAAALSLYALALMSKPMVVTLPLALLIADFWPLKRRAWAEKLPFAALAGCVCLITMRAQRAYIDPGFPWRYRLAAVPVFYMEYLGKMAWPSNLSLYYAHPGAALPPAEALACVLALAGVTVLAIRMKRQRAYLLAGWLWFLVTLLPVIGLVQITRRSIANRFTYIPQIGVVVAAVWALAEAKGAKRYAAPAGAALALACAVGTRRELSDWREPRTLYERTLATAPRNELFHNILGVYLARRGDYAGAQAEFVRAIAIRPGYADAHNDLGYLFSLEGRRADARKEYEQALKLEPRHPRASANLAALDAPARE